MVRDALGDGSRCGVRIRYVFDGPRPLRHRRRLCRAPLPALGDAFFVLLRRLVSGVRLRRRSSARFVASGKSGLMTVFRNDDQWDRSNVQFAGRANRLATTSRRTPADMHHIDYGLG